MPHAAGREHGPAAAHPTFLQAFESHGLFLRRQKRGDENEGRRQTDVRGMEETWLSPEYPRAPGCAEILRLETQQRHVIAGANRGAGAGGML